MTISAELHLQQGYIFCTALMENVNQLLLEFVFFLFLVSHRFSIIY